MASMDEISFNPAAEYVAPQMSQDDSIFMTGATNALNNMPGAVTSAFVSMGKVERTMLQGGFFDGPGGATTLFPRRSVDAAGKASWARKSISFEKRPYRPTPGHASSFFRRRLPSADLLVSGDKDRPYNPFQGAGLGNLLSKPFNKSISKLGRPGETAELFEEGFFGKASAARKLKSKDDMTDSVRSYIDKALSKADPFRRSAIKTMMETGAITPGEGMMYSSRGLMGRAMGGGMHAKRLMGESWDIHKAATKELADMMGTGARYEGAVTRLIRGGTEGTSKVLTGSSAEAITARRGVSILGGRIAEWTHSAVTEVGIRSGEHAAASTLGKELAKGATREAAEAAASTAAKKGAEKIGMRVAGSIVKKEAKELGVKAGTKVAAKLATRFGVTAAANLTPLAPIADILFVLDMIKMGVELTNDFIVQPGIRLMKDSIKSFKGSSTKDVFGMGFRDTEASMTSRSRGVQAIQNSRLNARSMLGSEAGALHQHFG